MGGQTRSEVRQEWNRGCTQINTDSYALPCEIHTPGRHAAPAAQYAERNRIPIQFRNLPSSGFIRVHLYPSVAK